MKFACSGCSIECLALVCRGTPKHVPTWVLLLKVICADVAAPFQWITWCITLAVISAQDAGHSKYIWLLGFNPYRLLLFLHCFFFMDYSYVSVQIGFNPKPTTHSLCCVFYTWQLLDGSFLLNDEWTAAFLWQMRKTVLWPVLEEINWCSSWDTVVPWVPAAVLNASVCKAGT